MASSIARKLSIQLYDHLTGAVRKSSTTSSNGSTTPPPSSSNADRSPSSTTVSPPSDALSSSNNSSDMSTTESSEFHCLTFIARCPDVERIEHAVFELTESLGQLLREEAVFFEVVHGELQLRVAHRHKKHFGELVATKRTETPLEKVFCVEGSVSVVQNVEQIRSTLNVTLPEIGFMSCKRRTFVKDRVTINIDDVTGFGFFVEVSVNLISGTSPQEADYDAIRSIQKALDISHNQYISHSYFDLHADFKASDSGLDENIEEDESGQDVNATDD